MDQRRPHGEVLRGGAQSDEEAILEQIGVVDGSLVDVDVDGRDGAVEGEGDLRQGEGSDETSSTRCHDYERRLNIRDGRQQTCALSAGRQDEKLRERERKNERETKAPQEMLTEMSDCRAGQGRPHVGILGMRPAYSWVVIAIAIAGLRLVQQDALTDIRPDGSLHFWGSGEALWPMGCRPARPRRACRNAMSSSKRAVESQRLCGVFWGGGLTFQGGGWWLVGCGYK